MASKQSMLTQLIKTGNLTILLANGERLQAGDGSEAPITVRFADQRVEDDLWRNPVMAFGELYSEGRLILDEGNIFDLISLMKRNGSSKAMPPAARLRGAIGYLTDKSKDRLSAERARADIAHHYDLEAGLFDLFLDRYKQYSCAFFPTTKETLDEAQLRKLRRIAAKLLVRPDETVMDIGCGWGGMAIYLAMVCKAKVRGITLSAQQAERARRTVGDLGLADRIAIELTDFRKAQGEVDKIVSVGMFEHVGPSQYRSFFDTTARLLKRRNGIILLHTITDTKPGRANNAWMEKYIFPGGYIPSVSEVTPHSEATNHLLKDLEVWPIHYARTLRFWRERFIARKAEAERLYDPRFVRMWEFYLAASEAGFRHDRLFVGQYQFARHQDALPHARDYIAAEEEHLAAAEVESGFVDLDLRTGAAAA